MLKKVQTNTFIALKSLLAKEDQEILQLFLFLSNSQMIKPKSKSV